MTANILIKNLTILKSHHPKAYEIIKNTDPSLEYEVSISQSGLPNLSYVGIKGKKKYLLSKYDPAQEAKRFIKSLDISDATNFIVLGIGLGYHIKELIKTTSEHSRILVIENDRSLTRLAFETNDLKQILTHPGLTLIFSNKQEDEIEVLEEEKVNFRLILREHKSHQVFPSSSYTSLWHHYLIEISFRRTLWLALPNHE